MTFEQFERQKAGRVKERINAMIADQPMYEDFTGHASMFGGEDKDEVQIERLKADFANTLSAVDESLVECMMIDLATHIAREEGR